MNAINVVVTVCSVLLIVLVVLLAYFILEFIVKVVLNSPGIVKRDPAVRPLQVTCASTPVRHSVPGKAVFSSATNQELASSWPLAPVAATPLEVGT